MIVSGQKYIIVIQALQTEPRSFVVEVRGTPAISSEVHYACGPRRNLGRLVNEIVRKAEGVRA